MRGCLDWVVLFLQTGCYSIQRHSKEWSGACTCMHRSSDRDVLVFQDFILAPPHRAAAGQRADTIINLQWPSTGVREHVDNISICNLIYIPAPIPRLTRDMRLGGDGLRGGGAKAFQMPTLEQR